MQRFLNCIQNTWWKYYVVILDHLEDPHNFGAIIRTCEAKGIKNIIIPKDRSVQVNDTVYKTSVGSKVRTFCSNPSGHVVIENHNGVMICNGHSYHSEELIKYLTFEDEKVLVDNGDTVLVIEHNLDIIHSEDNREKKIFRIRIKYVKNPLIMWIMIYIST